MRERDKKERWDERDEKECSIQNEYLSAFISLIAFFTCSSGSVSIMSVWTISNPWADMAYACEIQRYYKETDFPCNLTNTKPD